MIRTALILVLASLTTGACASRAAKPTPTPSEQTAPARAAVPEVEPTPPAAEKPDPTAFDENPFLLLDNREARGPRDLSIVVVGDVSQPATQWVEATERLRDKVFDPTRHLTMSGDLNFMNLENPVTALSPNAKKTYAFTSPPERLEWYFGAGFNMFSLANNHIADASQAGIDKTIEHLEAYAKKHGKNRVAMAGDVVSAEAM
mgnify:FL=1